MAVGTGQVSLGDIQTEYGGSNPIAISEYYDKGNAPSSGEIQIHADFQGTSNTFTLTISSNQQQLNLATYASNNGWDGSTENGSPYYVFEFQGILYDGTTVISESGPFIILK